MRATIDTSAWISVILSRLGRAEPIAAAVQSGRVTLVTSEPEFAKTSEVIERPRLIRTVEVRLLVRGLMAAVRVRCRLMGLPSCHW